MGRRGEGETAAEKGEEGYGGNRGCLRVRPLYTRMLPTSIPRRFCFQTC